MEPVNALAVSIARATGLRISDVLSLRTIQVREALTNGGRITIVEQKSGKTRDIVLSAEVMSSLLWVSRGSPDGFYCFPHRTNPCKHRTRQSVWKDMRKAMEKLGVQPYVYSPHSTRKAYAVEIYAQSHDIEYVKRILNHDNIAVTALYALSDKMQ